MLATSGLVQSQKSGRVRTCRLSPDALVCAEDWFQQQRAIWEARLDRFEAYVLQLKKEKERASAKRPSRTTKRKGSE